MIKPEQVGRIEFSSSCHKLNGSIPTPRDYPDLVGIHRDLKAAYDDLLPGSEVCYLPEGDMKLVTSWSGQRYNMTQKKWFNPYTNQVLSILIAADL